MAEEAFALSPISARAAQPSEADYDAIREAFMETSRGRWFLGEYAKRNRNADTRMVLDAVARIEETLTTQREPVVEDRTPEVLALIRKALAAAEEVATTALDRAAIGQNLGPIHRAVRIIKEISWRWREIGADGRICDLIDSQLTAIEGACEQIATIDPRDELKAAFDLIEREIALAELGEVATARPPDEAAEPAQASAEAVAPTSHMPVSEASEAAAGTAEAIPAAAMEVPQQGVARDDAEADAWTTADDMVEEEPFAEPTEVGELPDDAAADAHDEAVLDMIAFEMAAEDPEFDEDMAEPVTMATPPDEAVATEPAAETDAVEIAAAVAVIESPSPVAAHVTPLPVTPLLQPSLGASILASGIVQKPRAALSDPLAPIRRMTQAEKIAFFS